MKTMPETEMREIDTPEAEPEGRSARRAADRAGSRKRIAAIMAAAGIAVIAFAVAGPVGSDHQTADPASSSPDAPARVAGTPTTEAKPPTTGPGGVGVDPERTGLPAVPADGKVRTGSKEDGCFSDVRSYLEQWHNTGVEPDPCFTSQPASSQDQPKDVQRSYNGEKF